MTKTHLIRIAVVAANLPARICFLGVLLAILPTLPAKGTTLTADQVAQAALGAGFSGGALVNAVAIADAESQFVLEAQCDNCVEGVTENSCGLWQINIDAHSGYDESQLLSSASYNAMAAYQISNATSATGADWLPWSTFESGDFISYLAIARSAAQNIDSTVIRGANDRVSATARLKVRPTAGDASFTRIVNAGTTGTVIDVPVVAIISGDTTGYYYIWWKIHWDDGGADGWSVEDFMTRMGTSFVMCPSADLTGDCFVDFADFTVLASQWLTGGNSVTLPSDMNMVLIPAGTFLMGDGYSEGGSDELPLHYVTLSSFSIGKYDITNGQYCDFLNAVHLSGLKIASGVVYASSDSSNSYPYCTTYWNTQNPDSQIAYAHAVFSVRTKGVRSMVNDPVIDVSWYGAAAYCNWRSQQEGKGQCYNNLLTWTCDFTQNGYHLPTEAQWEYAARGGLSSYRFPWGDTISRSQANYYNYNNDYYYDLGGPPWGYDPTWSSDGITPFTSPVGSFAVNGYNLCDMAGNVLQLCNDWYGSYSSSPQINPTGPASGYYRVFRGGSWAQTASNCRAASRYPAPPSGCSSEYGFRLVLGLN